MRLCRFRGRFFRANSSRLVILMAFVVTTLFLLGRNDLFKIKDGDNHTFDSDFVLPGSQLALNSVLSKQEDIDSPNYKVQKQIYQISARFQTTNQFSPLAGKIDNSLSLDLKRYRTFVDEHNSRQQVMNGEIFSPALVKNSLVIVVQVHNRPDYFEYLIQSLRTAKGISDALLVISHDFLSEEMNRLVKTIDFCKVMQIFFPFTIQLYPNEFPGTDPNDCPRDISKAKALEIRCNNAEHPDKYGHYREAIFTMTKHHWWWKANTVFDILNITRNYNGPVLFLEEDHFVAPDFYHTLQLLYDRKLNHVDCQKESCDIMTLGTYRKVSDFAAVGENLVEKITWTSVDHNMGMAFDRSLWNEIKTCSKMFCTYDDYNWDWTLMKVSMNCYKRRWKALVMKAPRVFHIGVCGVHHKTAQCNTKLFVKTFEDILETNKDKLYPRSLVLQMASKDEPNLGRPNGGWGDIRDHQLCLNFVRSS